MRIMTPGFMFLLLLMSATVVIFPVGMMAKISFLVILHLYAIGGFALEHVRNPNFKHAKDVIIGLTCSLLILVAAGVWEYLQLLEPPSDATVLTPEFSTDPDDDNEP